MKRKQIKVNNYQLYICFFFIKLIALILRIVYTPTVELVTDDARTNFAKESASTLKFREIKTKDTESKRGIK